MLRARRPSHLMIEERPTPPSQPSPHIPSPPTHGYSAGLSPRYTLSSPYAAQFESFSPINSSSSSSTSTVSTPHKPTFLPSLDPTRTIDTDSMSRTISKQKKIIHDLQIRITELEIENRSLKEMIKEKEDDSVEKMDIIRPRMGKLQPLIIPDIISYADAIHFQPHSPSTPHRGIQSPLNRSPPTHSKSISTTSTFTSLTPTTMPSPPRRLLSHPIRRASQPVLATLSPRPPSSEGPRDFTPRSPKTRPTKPRRVSVTTETCDEDVALTALIRHIPVATINERMIAAATVTNSVASTATSTARSSALPSASIGTPRSLLSPDSHLSPSHSRLYSNSLSQSQSQSHPRSFSIDTSEDGDFIHRDHDDTTSMTSLLSLLPTHTSIYTRMEYDELSSTTATAAPSMQHSEHNSPRQHEDEIHVQITSHDTAEHPHDVPSHDIEGISHKMIQHDQPLYDVEDTSHRMMIQHDASHVQDISHKVQHDPSSHDIEDICHKTIRHYSNVSTDGIVPTIQIESINEQMIVPTIEIDSVNEHVIAPVMATIDALQIETPEMTVTVTNTVTGSTSPAPIPYESLPSPIIDETVPTKRDSITSITSISPPASIVTSISSISPLSPISQIDDADSTSTSQQRPHVTFDQSANDLPLPRRARHLSIDWRDSHQSSRIHSRAHSIGEELSLGMSRSLSRSHSHSQNPFDDEIEVMNAVAGVESSTPRSPRSLVTIEAELSLSSMEHKHESRCSNDSRRSTWDKTKRCIISPEHDEEMK